MLPVVAAIVPIYLAVRDIGMLDSIPTLIVLYTAMNLPIAVWMMRSFFCGRGGARQANAPVAGHAPFRDPGRARSAMKPR